MTAETLSAALEREHHEIDAGIKTFIDHLAEGTLQPVPLVNALQALQRHIYLEEVLLFPPLREAGLAMPIFVMMREHGQLWRITETLMGFVDAGADSGRVLHVCRDLLAELDQHNMKEEPVIYPHADTDLPAQTRTELARFIEDGRTPQGWVCQHANMSEQVTAPHVGAGTSTATAPRRIRTENPNAR